MDTVKFGNQDTEQKYDLSALKIAEDKFVVRHFEFLTLANGEKMEDPSTSRFQVYDQRTFNDLNRQPVKDGKQMPSKFEDIGLNVDVLHNPLAEAAEATKPAAGAAKKLSAPELVSLINNALDADEVNSLLGTDEIRKTVLDAAEKKIQSFQA